MIMVILLYGRVALFFCINHKCELNSTHYDSYLVQQYDKEYRLWARDLKTQMEMTAWVRNVRQA